MTQKTYSIKEVAKMLHITTQAIGQWLSKHPDVKNNSEYIIKKNPNATKSQMSLTEKGLAAYSILRANNNPNKDNVKVLFNNQVKSQIVDNLMSNKTSLISVEQYNELRAEINELKDILKTRPQLEAPKQLDLSDMFSEPTVEVPELTKRDELVMLLKTYTYKHKYNYKEVWNYLYAQFNNRYHLNIRSRKNNDDETLVDTAERIGMLDELYAVAVLLYKGK